MAGAMGGFLAGSIVAKMLLDKSGWNAGIASAEGDVKKLKAQTGTWSDSIKGMGTVWAATGAVVVGTVGNMIMKNAEYMDSIGKMSQRTGVSTEDLSSFKLALDNSGSSLDNFAFGMKGLADKMAAARSGNKESVQLFKSLGISFQTATGQLRPLKDVFIDIAERFKGINDGAEKTALAVDIFGRAGMNLIPTLDLGKDGLQKWTDRAKELNMVVSSDSAAAASTFTDKLNELKGAFEGAAKEILIKLLPTLTKLVERLIPTVQKIMDLIDKTKIIQTEIDVFAFKIGLLADAFDILFSSIQNIPSILPGIIPNFADVGKKAEEAGDGIGFFTQKLKDLVSPLSDAGKQLSLFHDKFNVLTIDDYKNKIKEIQNTLEHYKGVIPIPEQKRLNEELENARMAIEPLLPPFAGLNDVCLDMGLISMPALNKEFKDGPYFIRKYYSEIQKAWRNIKELPDDLVEARAASYEFLHVPSEDNTWTPTLEEINENLWDMYDELERGVQYWENLKEIATRTLEDIARALVDVFDLHSILVYQAKEFDSSYFDSLEKAARDAYKSQQSAFNDAFSAQELIIRRAEEDEDIRYKREYDAQQEAIRNSTMSREEQEVALKALEIKYEDEKLARERKREDERLAREKQHKADLLAMELQHEINVQKIKDDAEKARIEFENRELARQNSLWNKVKDIFATAVEDMATLWVTKFLTDIIERATKKSAKVAADTLVDIGEKVIETTGNVAGETAKVATGAMSGVALSAINTISGLVTAAASVLSLFKKEDYSSITYWLKFISDNTQEIHDVMTLNYLNMFESWNSLFESDNFCFYELHGRIVETRDAISYWGGAIVDAVKGIKGAQHGYVAMSNELVMVHGTPSIPEIILPEPIYERNLQMAAAMGGGQPGRPIEIYLNGEPIKFPMKENMRKIAIELIPYMTKNEQLKIHPRSVRAF